MSNNDVAKTGWCPRCHKRHRVHIKWGLVNYVPSLIGGIFRCPSIGKGVVVSAMIVDKSRGKLGWML